MADPLSHRAEQAIRTLEQLLRDHREATNDAESADRFAREAQALLERALPFLSGTTVGGDVAAFLERHGAEVA
jgi:hypothetical protein